MQQVVKRFTRLICQDSVQHSMNPALLWKKYWIPLLNNCRKNRFYAAGHWAACWLCKLQRVTPKNLQQLSLLAAIYISPTRTIGPACPLQTINNSASDLLTSQKRPGSVF